MNFRFTEIVLTVKSIEFEIICYLNFCSHESDVKCQMFDYLFAQFLPCHFSMTLLSAFQCQIGEEFFDC